MEIRIFDTENLAAGYVADTVEALLREKPEAVLCLAAGHTSLPVFDELAQRALDFSLTHIIGLDDWLGVGPDTDGSCAAFLRRNFFSRVNLRTENIRLFNALTQDPEAECAAMERQIADWGGLDYLLLGMGMNGHLALNEPGDSFARRAHVTSLSDTTRQVAPKYFPAGMPAITQGITLGIADFMEARCVHLAVFGSHKAPMVARLLAEDPSEELPATALKTLLQAQLLLDHAALDGAACV